MDASEIPSTASSAPRRLLDIELHCKDGVLLASSQVLGLNSTVFEKMLFSVVQMLESKTSIILLDDVKKADMELILKFYVPRQDYYNSQRSIERIYNINNSRCPSPRL